MKAFRIFPLFALPLILVAGGVFVDASTEHADTGEHAEHDDEEHAERADDEHEEGVVRIHPGAAARVTIRTMEAQERSLDAMLFTTGRVDFNQDRLAHISPRIPGRVHTVNAVLGQSVEAHEALLVIDSIELGAAKSTLLQVKAQLGLTERTLKREQGLLRDKITTEQAVLEARTANQQALAVLQAARERLRLLGLSETEIDSVHHNDPAAPLFSLRTPIDGTVVEKRASLGERISPDKSPYIVADLSTLWIWIDVYERDLARVHLDDTAQVTVPAHANRTFQGTVTYIRSSVDPDTRTSRARITVDNAAGHLKPGMFASVTVIDPHVGTAGGVVVPASAIQRDGRSAIAFVRTDENLYERRELRIGRRTEGFVQILDGIDPGEPVVVEGAFILKSEAAKESMGGGYDH